jgi:hypothetical protein
LRSCFADYPDRRYFKLPPRFRYLAPVAGTLVGQLGVELRTIRAGDQVLRTLGVVDLCVRAESRTHGLAGRLLAEVTGFAHIPHGIDFCGACSPTTAGSTSDTAGPTRDNRPDLGGRSTSTTPSGWPPANSSRH